MPQIKKIKILILEDNKIFQEKFKELLEKFHFELLGMSDKETDLLKQLQEHKEVQVLLLDLVIPGIDMFELIGKIKRTYPALSLIVCSSLTEEHIVSSFLKAGCFDYIFKPFEENRLLDSIKRAAA